MTTKLSHHNLTKIKNFCVQIIKDDVDLDEICKKYRLEVIIESELNKQFNTVRQVFRWLYLTRIKNQCSGLLYIDLILVAINKELKKDLTDIQFEIIREVVYLYLKERSHYHNRKRGY